MSIICLLCSEKFESKWELGGHLKNHNITASEYKDKFGLYEKCKKCEKRISRNNKHGYCNSCRDRTGENNPFYGKSHSDETIEVLKEKCSIGMKEKWKDEEFRSKVIKGGSKPRRESFKREQSERIKQWYVDNPEQRQLRSECMKRTWESGAITKNNYSCNASKLEKELYEEILKIIPDAESKKTIRDSNNRWIFPDILIESCGVIIEFYGDFWHANPAIYEKNDIIHNGITAEKIWEKDKERTIRLGDIISEGEKFPRGYTVIVVWEKDYKENKKAVLNEIDMLINYEGCAL